VPRIPYHKTGGNTLNIGPTEIILIVVAVLLLFGAKKLPEIGRSIGKGVNEFKKGMSGTGGIDEEEDKKAKRKKRPASKAKKKVKKKKKK